MSALSPTVPAPPERLATLRILVGGFALGVLLVRFPAFWSSAGFEARRFEPIGVLWWLDGPLPVGVARGLLLVAIAAGVAFVAGWRWRVVGPAFALTFLAVTTYRLSWGHVLHTEHLPALHLLVLGFVPAADALSFDARRRADRPGPDPGYAWPVTVMAVIVVVAYVLAGLAKLRNGGWDWLAGDVLRNQVAYDNLRKVLLGDLHSPVGGWLVGVGWVFPPLSALTVAVELGAPLALLGGRARTVWAVLAWAFHVGVLVLMAIAFPYQLLGIAYAPFFACERLWPQARSMLSAARRPSRIAS